LTCVVLAVNLPKARRSYSQETGTQVSSAVALPANSFSVYSDSADVGGPRGVSITASLLASRSAGSGDASATGVRTADDDSVVGGILPS